MLLNLLIIVICNPHIVNPGPVISDCIRMPVVLILNETWLSSDHSDNEILSEDCFKLFRLDGSDKTHPYDPLNPRKYRQRWRSNDCYQSKT